MDNNAPPQVLSPVDQEQEEVNKTEQEIQKKYYQTPKFEKWAQLMQDKDHVSEVTGEHTYMNQTQSAIEAYNLDPVKQYQLAAVTGSKNIKKYKGLAGIHYAKSGITFSKVLDVLWNKAIASNNLELLVWVLQVIDVQLEKELPTGKQQMPNGNQFFFEGGLNFNQFKDEQLVQFLNNRRAQIARRGGSSAPGAGEEDQSKPSEVVETASEADRGIIERQADPGTVLGQPGGQNGVGSTGGSQIRVGRTFLPPDNTTS